MSQTYLFSPYVAAAAGSAPPPDDESYKKKIKKLGNDAIKDGEEIFKGLRSAAESDEGNKPVEEWRKKIREKAEETKKKLNDRIDQFTKKTEDYIESLPEERQNEAANWFNNVITTVTSFLGKVVDAIMSVIRWVAQKVADLVTKIRNTAGSIIQWAKEALGIVSK